MLNRRPQSQVDETVSIFLAKNLLRVRDRAGATRPLAANPAQLAFERDRGTRNIVLKARQMGITTWIAGRFFLKTITARGVLTVLVAHTRESAQMIFRVVQRFWENLPEEFREGPLSRKTANVRSMSFPALDSEFRVLSASDRNAGRGLTMQNLHCSEVARWPGNAAETLAGLRAALAPGGELVIESTPSGAYGCFYDEWLKAVDPAPGYTFEDAVPDAIVRHFFPWWMEPAYTASAATSLTPEEEELVRQHNLTPGQIGFRRTLEAGFERNRSQEYAEDPETCFRATGDCCFDIAAIETRLAEAGHPVATRRLGALHIWLPPQTDKDYVLGVDTAGGTGEGDFAAIQVIELETGLQCAELQQRLSMMDQAKACAELAREYNGALVAIERNNHGSGVLANLGSIEQYKNVYYHADGKEGWHTTTATKPEMVARMGALLGESPRLFFSRRLLGECRTFVAFFGGRTGAANGAHDDCFMAMAVAHAVRAELLNKTGKRGD